MKERCINYLLNVSFHLAIPSKIRSHPILPTKTRIQILKTEKETPTHHSRTQLPRRKPQIPTSTSRQEEAKNSKRPHEASKFRIVFSARIARSGSNASMKRLKMRRIISSRLILRWVKRCLETANCEEEARIWGIFARRGSGLWRWVGWILEKSAEERRENEGGVELIWKSVERSIEGGDRERRGCCLVDVMKERENTRTRPEDELQFTRERKKARKGFSSSSCLGMGGRRGSFRCFFILFYLL